MYALQQRDRSNRYSDYIAAFTKLRGRDLPGAMQELEKYLRGNPEDGDALRLQKAIQGENMGKTIGSV